SSRCAQRPNSTSMRSACVASRDESGTLPSAGSVWECTSAISPCTYMVGVWMQRLHYEKVEPAIPAGNTPTSGLRMQPARRGAVCLAPRSENGKRLPSSSGLSIEVTSRGAISRFACGNTALNLFVGNELEGGPANLYLRRHRSGTTELTPLLGPRSPTR